MIKLLTSDKTDEFTSFCSKTPLGSVILTKMLAYGTDCAIQYFWYGEYGGKICAVYNLDSSLMTISATKPDYDETLEFIKITGCKSVYTDFPPDIPTKNPVRDEILIYNNINNRGAPDASDIDSENIKSIFPVIYEDLADVERKNLYETWYPDISLKKRRGLIRAKGIYAENRLVSCAVTCAENDETAVITGVATLREFRRKGYAGRCVLSLTQELAAQGKRVYLITDNDKTKKWYEKAGFERFSYRYSFEL